MLLQWTGGVDHGVIVQTESFEIEGNLRIAVGRHWVREALTGMVKTIVAQILVSVVIWHYHTICSNDLGRELGGTFSILSDVQVSFPAMVLAVTGHRPLSHQY